MSDPKPLQKKNFSPDWLVRGALTKLGDAFDRLTGRGWKPSSSLATSELIDRLNKLLDSEMRDVPGEGRFVPHNIKLKMQWDKFSTDSEGAIAKLEHELLAAAIDHINDRLYHTYAPLKLEIKPDYFTQGVKLLASFESFAEEDHEAELNVTVPEINISGALPGNLPKPEAASEQETYIVTFSAGAGPKRVTLVFTGGQQLSVGRTVENNLAIDHHSVSKIHASLVIGPEGQLMVADTGSTNGTFINGERISYGKAYPVAEGNIVKFGLVDVVFEYVAKPVEAPPEDDDAHDAETIAIGEFEFRKKVDLLEYPDTSSLPGSASETGDVVEPVKPAGTPGSPLPAPQTEILKPLNIESRETADIDRKPGDGFGLPEKPDDGEEVTS